LALAEPVISLDVQEPSLVDELLSGHQEEPEMVVQETEAVVAGECGKKRKLARTEEENGLSAADLDHEYSAKKPRTSTVTVEETTTSPGKKSTANRRIKNNIASKKSRYNRKLKFVEMESEAERLVQENEKMKLKIEELEELAKEMKAALINKLAEKK
jgi:hypothetical protein